MKMFVKALAVVCVAALLFVCVGCNVGKTPLPDQSDNGSIVDSDKANAPDNSQTPNAPSNPDMPEIPDDDKDYNVTKKNEASFVAYAKSLESGAKFNYYLFTPAEAKENMPLIVYLHGGSGKPQTVEGDLSLLIAGDGLPKFVHDGQVSPSCYIVFPQLPYGKKGWSDVKTDLLDFLRAVVDELHCDTEKVSITGHSMGGKGTWDIALAYPEFFYKVAPLSGNVTLNNQNLSKLNDKPIWAIVGSADTIVDPQSSIDFIAALAKINNKAKITVIDGYDHFDVPNAYLSTEYNLLSWLVE